MRNYVIINGVNSLTIQGLAINNLPPITKPMIRTQREEIDGRDGDIVTELGYSAYDKQIEIGLWGTYDINDIIKYFTGEGTIVFSNEEDKYYNFKILDQIDYEKLLKFKTATITLHCQPFKYPLEEEPVEAEITTLTGTGETLTLNNTEEAPMSLVYKGNTSQNGTPTPNNLVPIQVVSGDNEVIVSNGDNTQSTTYPINLPEGMFLGGMGDYKDTFFKAKEGDPIYDSLDSATKQTLDSNEWYLEKKIGKAQVSLSEPIYNIGNYKGAVFIPSTLKVRAILGLAYCSKSLIALTSSQRVEGRFYENPLNYMFIGSSTDTITELKEKYDGSDFYYPIATPTYTLIEDSTLIEELESMKKSYEGQTNISQTNNDLPFELDVSVTFLTPMEINNIGNIYAKPILTIEGTGNIGVVLNDIQILDIDLTNNGKIAIDVTKLEAYNPDDDTLLNRLVTGDYMKLLINEGENTITFTGNVSSATLTNYIRWI